jgi:hypothetical protein
MALVPVTVHGGQYLGYDLQPAANGSVKFTPLAGWIPDAVDVLDYVPATVEQDIAAGQIQVTLVAPGTSSDPEIQYRVDVSTAGIKDSYVIQMPVAPADDAVLELSSRDPDTGLLSGGTGGGGGGFGGGGHGGFGD